MYKKQNKTNNKYLKVNSDSSSDSRAMENAYCRSVKSEMTYANLSMYDTCHCLKSGAAFINWLPPIFVILLVGYTYYVYVVTFCVNYLKSGSKFYAYLVVYHILVFLFIWSFCETMLTVHEAIPEEYTLNTEEHDKLLSYNDSQIDLILKKLVELRQIEIVTISDHGRIRYCRHCQLLKPDRAHHCSSCDRCILRMDHHCPWINNCVGFSNYKYFILLLMYSSLMCIFYIATLGPHILQFLEGFLSNWTHIHLSMGFVFAAISAVLVISLLCYHLNLVRKNETTLESLHDITFIDDSLTFNLGCSSNFVQVFGPNPLLWFIPLYSAEGTGCEFPVKHIP